METSSYQHLYDQIKEVSEREGLPKIILVTGKNFAGNQLASIILKDFGWFSFYEKCIENNRDYSEYADLIEDHKRFSDRMNKPVARMTQSLELIKKAAELGDVWLIRLDEHRFDKGYYDVVTYNDFGMQAINDADYEVRG